MILLGTTSPKNVVFVIKSILEKNRNKIPLMCDIDGLEELVCKSCTEIIKSKVNKLYQEYKERNDYVIVDPVEQKN